MINPSSSTDRNALFKWSVYQLVGSTFVKFADGMWLNIWSIYKLEADATMGITDRYLLTEFLTHNKQGLQKYCETAYSRSGINQMCILRNSKEWLEHLKLPNFNLVTSINSLDFSTLYTTIPHQKLKAGLQLSSWTFSFTKNGNRRYKCLVLGRKGPCCVKEHHDLESKYTEDDIINMLEFLVDNIFVVSGGKVFQQIVDIPMGSNCAPLLDDIFMNSYEADSWVFALGWKETVSISNSTSHIDTSMR